eukprot:comp24126_c0_seq1/m.43770 comp24126_c0_seq1/g.43770  ORF comp24126_c0_seq1/g.43770 comp24126_c0_seq1/m.43770 type:complete len:388 (+) comp24126_c0_seq1:212-1375(+)
MRPMFWVWLMSSAASTSSRMYTGAGLNSSMARISDRATRDFWPPLSSARLCFQTEPKATLISSPSCTLRSSTVASLHCVPGSRVEKIFPKWPLTMWAVFSSCSSFFLSSSLIEARIFSLSLSTLDFLLTSSLYSVSFCWNCAMAFVLMFFSLRAFSCLSFCRVALAWCTSRLLKSYLLSAWPKNCSSSAIHLCCRYRLATVASVSALSFSRVFLLCPACLRSIASCSSSSLAAPCSSVALRSSLSVAAILLRLSLSRSCASWYSRCSAASLASFSCMSLLIWAMALSWSATCPSTLAMSRLCCSISARSLMASCSLALNVLRVLATAFFCSLISASMRLSAPSLLDVNSFSCCCSLEMFALASFSCFSAAAIFSACLAISVSRSRSS